MQALWQHCKVCVPALIAALLGWSHGCNHQILARIETGALHLQGLAALMDAGRRLEDLEYLDAHVLCSAMFRAREHLTPSELANLSSLLHVVPGTLPPQCSAGRRNRGLLVHIMSHYVLTGTSGADATCSLCLLAVSNAVHSCLAPCMRSTVSAFLTLMLLSVTQATNCHCSLPHIPIIWWLCQALCCMLPWLWAQEFAAGQDELHRLVKLLMWDRALLRGMDRWGRQGPVHCCRPETWLQMTFGSALFNTCMA